MQKIEFNQAKKKIQFIETINKAFQFHNQDAIPILNCIVNLLHYMIIFTKTLPNCTISEAPNSQPKQTMLLVSNHSLHNHWQSNVTKAMNSKHFIIHSLYFLSFIFPSSSFTFFVNLQMCLTSLSHLSHLLVSYHLKQPQPSPP